MASRPGNPLGGCLDEGTGLEGVGDVTDRQLLERFASRRDEAAFAALVRRHGPMVRGVCRRLLRHAQDAEDAFQATFLVLVRKAGSIARGELVGNWLYGVACRTAARARAEAGKRRAHEPLRLDPPAAEPTPEVVWRDLRPVLDEEVQRLPDRYRAPFVLCYLEGKTNEEAARQLGCPKGTVLSRLARARLRLRTRLARRGLALSAGLWATVLSQGAAPAAVPVALADATIQAAPLVAAGAAAAAGAVSARVAGLTEGVVHAMFLTRLKIATVWSLALAVLGGVAVWFLYGALAAEGPKDDQARIQGTWQSVSVVRGGEKAPDDYVIKLIFAGEKVTFVRQGQEERGQGTYKLDPSKKPKAIDFGISDEEGATGIYELEGDTLKLCMVEVGNERPTEFAGRDKQVLIVLKREPAAKKAADPKKD